MIDILYLVVKALQKRDDVLLLIVQMMVDIPICIASLKNSLKTCLL